MRRRTGYVLVAVGVVVAIVVIFRIVPLVRPGWVCEGPTDVPAGGEWTQGAAMPTVRAETAATSVGDRIYVAGGMIGGWLTTPILEIYDAATDSWTTGAPMPVAVHHAGVVTALGRVYVFGGYDDIGKMVRAEPDIAQNWYYDPETDIWTEISPMPAPRAAHAAVNIDDLIYLVGGTGTGAADVWVYDPAADSWDTSRQGKLPTPREHVPAVVLDGSIYVVGGRWQDVSVPEVEVYDPAADTWTQVADIPTPRSALSLAAFAGKIYTTGGEDLDTGCTYGVYEVYDPATDSWSKLLDMPTPRHAMLSAVIDDRWYLIGGATEAGARTEPSLTGILEIFVPQRT